MFKFLVLWLPIVCMAQGRLDGRVALITGGAQGIGKGIAQVFAREGAHVMIADIQDEEGKRTAEEVGGEYLHLDVSKEADWETAMEKVLKNYSRLDILVNNAGMRGYGDPEHCSLEDWKRTQSVDLDGVFLGCKHAIGAMKNTTEHGAIINISSIAWTRGIPSGPDYAASKAAVANLTQSVAVYCGQQSYPIRCNWISPGFTDTPLLDAVKKKPWFQDYIRSIPLGIMGTPEDIGNGALFLASDESKYMTGAELRIDGGTTAWSGIPWTRKN